MGIKVTIDRTFIVNGKKYSTVDEMPQKVRELYEKARALSAGGKLAVGQVEARAAIDFNGKTYAGVEEMPSDARQAYESVMAAVEAGKGEAPEAVPVAAINADPIEPSSSFPLGSVFWKIAAAVALGLVLLYFLGR